MKEIEETKIKKLSGSVEVWKQKIEDPLTGMVCVYYQVIIEEFRNEKWRKIKSERRGIDFCIRYSEKNIYIAVSHGAGAWMALTEKVSQPQRADPAQLPARLFKFLESTPVPMNSMIRIRHSILRFGECISVAGRFLSEDHIILPAQINDLQKPRSALLKEAWSSLFASSSQNKKGCILIAAVAASSFSADDRTTIAGQNVPEEEYKEEIPTLTSALPDIYDSRTLHHEKNFYDLHLRSHQYPHKEDDNLLSMRHLIEGEDHPDFCARLPSFDNKALFPRQSSSKNNTPSFCLDAVVRV